MKTKATASQMRRQALAHLEEKHFIRKGMFDSPAWPGIIAELADEKKLVFVRHGANEVYVTKAVAMARPPEAKVQRYKPSDDSLEHHESCA